MSMTPVPKIVGDLRVVPRRKRVKGPQTKLPGPISDRVEMYYPFRR